MAELPSISIIIAALNSEEYLRPCLESCYMQDYPDFEVILVDNASTDATPAIGAEFEAKGLKIVRNSFNRGFSGGNNDGVWASRGEIVFLLNSDAFFSTPGDLREVARAFAERPDLGILGAKILCPDGETLLHCGGTFGIPAHCSLYGRGEKDQGQWDQVREVELVVGAAIALRRTFWDQLRGLDEDFNPIYYEDSDLCYRTLRLGLKVLYWPALRLTHVECVTYNIRSLKFARQHHRNRVWFLLKNYPLSVLIFQVLPVELRWFLMRDHVHIRRLMLKNYYLGLKKFVQRRLLRIPRPQDRLYTGGNKPLAPLSLKK